MSFIGIGAAVGTAAFKIGTGIHQNHLANEVNVPDANYSSSPYASKILGQASLMLNSRSPGSVIAQQGIEGNQANAMGSTQRNATSGSQALGMLGGIQGNADTGYNNLAQNQDNYHLNAVNNYNQANQGMVNEGDKVYQSQLQNRLEAIQEKTSLRGAGSQNIGGGMNDLTNSAFLGDAMGAFGGNNGGGGSGIPPISRTPYGYNGVNPYMNPSTGYINPNPYIHG